jgi:flavin-dependent dehydrogenase
MAEQLKHGGGHLREYWQGFVAKLKRRGLVRYDDYDPRGYSYYIRGNVEAISDRNAYIVGDAAGLATRDMCEGIGPAVRSGLLASRSIVTGEPYSLASVGSLSGTSFVSRLLERQFAGH